MTRVETFGHRIGSGATLVVTSIAHWPSQAENSEKKTGRWIILAVTGWLGEQLVQHTHLLGLGAAAAFAAAAWKQGSAPAPSEPDEPSDARIVMVRMVVDLIGDRAGIHLAELLPTMAAVNERWARWDQTHLKRVLVEMGLPVRKQLRVGPVGGRAGVHRDDALRALAALTTPPDVEPDVEAPSEGVDAGRSTCDHPA